MSTMKGNVTVWYVSVSDQDYNQAILDGVLDRTLPIAIECPKPCLSETAVIPLDLLKEVA